MCALYGSEMDTPTARERSATITPIHTARTGDLRVMEIVASALPVTLLTPDAPDTYTVTGVFSRSVDPIEAAILHSHTSSATITAAGFPGVTLHVSDRRLLIGNTNLDMLQAGLANVIGQLLLDAATTAVIRRQQVETDLAQALAADAERAERVRDITSTISFGPSRYS